MLFAWNAVAPLAIALGMLNIKITKKHNYYLGTNYIEYHYITHSALYPADNWM